MDSVPASIRARAQRLLAMEAANKSASDTSGQEIQRVLEKLGTSLAQLVGADGFVSLMRRALALARSEVPSLRIEKITADGHLEGMEEFAGEAKIDIEAGAAIVAHLLGLLVTFIGEPITLRLMIDIWPDESGPTTVESEDFR
jgi:hypothetical protein